jgi:hypothetical protein
VPGRNDFARLSCQASIALATKMVVLNRAKNAINIGMPFVFLERHPASAALHSQREIVSVANSDRHSDK